VIRVLIIDDEALVRDGLRAIIELEDDLTVVGEGADGEAALRLARSAKPDVVLLDVRMPGMDGLEAARHLLRAPAAPRVVMLTTFDRDEYLYAAMQAGASGFLLKDMRRGQLTAAIRTVAAGNALVAPSITRRLIEAFCQRTAGVEPSVLAVLTARELEVLRLLARGLSNAEIAEALTVGETTVKTHVGRILEKLGLRDRVQAVVLAYECGLIEPGKP
jgi:DNA-binding NarL/FixJ family response regulator